MIRKYKQLSILVLVVLLGACRKDFTSINTDPNSANTISPQYLLSTVLINTAYNYQADAFTSKPAEAGRYITKVRNEGDDKFGWSATSWDGYYQRLIQGKQMYDLAKAGNQTQYMAVSDIMKVFNFAYITDLYGDCPYTQALQSKDSGIIHPKYDRQADIYPALLNTLVAANKALASTTGTIDSKYDVMYGGSALAWRKFANALRLRLLLRISKKYSAAFTDIQTIVSDPSTYPIFTGNGDNAQIKYLGKTAFDSWQGGVLNNSVTEINKYKPSKQLIDSMLSMADPRVPIWFQPVQATGGTKDQNLYVGVPNAIPAPYDYNGGEAHISYLGTIFYSNSNSLVNARMMTYTEQCFILAEAALTGSVNVPNETAATLYAKGIGSSMDQFGVAAPDKQNYLQQPSVVFNGTLNQLITQKWISGFLCGPEGWFDHRRTGLPVFVLGPLSVIPDVPARFLYPTAEQATNLDQYNAALATQGPDATTTLMWYLK